MISNADLRVGFVCLLLFVGSVCAQEKFILSTKVGDKSEETKTTTTLTPVTKTPLQKLVCPKQVRIPIFSLPCNSEKDCRVFGPALACCQERCIRGVLVPATETSRRARVSNLIEDSAEKPSKQTSKSPTKSTIPTKSQAIESPKLICPGSEVRVPFFSLPCSGDLNCQFFGPGLLCCKNRCLRGVVPPKPEVEHSPALFGLVDRVCSNEPLAEILDIRECTTDIECAPRICCPEKRAKKGTSKSFCRTPIHNIDRLPVPKQLEQPIRNFVSYMQCTPPPPLDLFPKPCQNTLDCFPNLCCQENGNKVCRPPKRSIFTFLADVTTRIGATNVTRRFIQRITN